MEEEQCLIEPLGQFGDYKGLSGCYWCFLFEECLKANPKKKKVFKDNKAQEINTFGRLFK